MSWAWLTTLILFLYVAAATLILDEAPIGQHVAKVTITPGKTPVIIGHAELGQYPGVVSAETNHMEVTHGEDGWWIANISAERKIDVPSALHKERLVRRWELETGDQLQFGKTIIKVAAASPTQLHLQGPGGDAIWANAQLKQPLPTYDKCPDEGTNQWWRAFTDQQSRERLLFTIGGQVPCAYRWHINGIPAGAAKILWQADSQAYLLAPGTAEVRFRAKGETTLHSFTDMQLRLDVDPRDKRKEQASMIVLGRTPYKPFWDDKTLILIPVGGDIWPVPTHTNNNTEPTPIPRDARVHLEWESSTKANLLEWLQTSWPAILATITLWGIALATVMQLRSDPETRRLRISTIPPALAMSVLTMAMYYMDNTPSSIMLGSIGLAWTWGTVLLMIKGRLRGTAGLLWTLGLGLILAGAIVQGQLGIGADNYKWYRFAKGHWLILATVGWAMLPFTIITTNTLHNTLFYLVDSNPPAGPQTPRWLHMLTLGLWKSSGYILPAIAVSALTMQFLFGKEEGVWGIQPVEGVKTIVVLMLAYAGMLVQERRADQGRYHREHPYKSILEFIWFVMLFVLFISAALWQVRDMSPVIIVILLFLPTIWRLARNPDPNQTSERGRIVRAVIALLVSIMALLYTLIPANYTIVPRSVPQYERIMVWAQPALFPNSGFQVHKAQTEAAAGGDYGVTNTTPFGWNGRIMNLPVVQNDFIGAFVLNRFGSIASIALLWLQIAFIATLFAISRTATAWQQQQGPTGKKLGRFLSLALFALAWVFLAHSLIAWANVLGLLPVMGQPMTFIAAGGSHLIAFAFPVFILGLATSWFTTETTR